MAIGSSLTVVDYILSGVQTGQIQLSFDGTNPSSIILGNWEATPVAVQYGGTGASSHTPYTLICAGTTNIGAFQNVVSVGTAGQVLVSNGPAALPTFQSIVGTVNSVTGTTNQITASPTSGAVLLSIPNTFIAPGSIASSTTNAAGTYFQLPNTSPTGGALQIGGINTLHTFGTSNTFVGMSSGNTTLSGSQNSFLGFNSGHALTSGNSNVGVGLALSALTTGHGNVVVGSSSGLSIVTGSENNLIGFGLASNYTSSESFNILIGSGIVGVTGESNILRIGNGTGSSAGELFASYISGIYGSPTALASNGLLVLCDGNNLLGTIAAGTNGQILTSNGVGALPSFKDAPSGSISSVLGTTNQISVTTLLGVAKVSLPNTVIAPGSLSATTFVSAGTVVSANTYLQLPTTSATGGALQIEGVNVFQTFGLNNLFIGVHAGNTTGITTAQFNVGVGEQALNNIVTGLANTSIGHSALPQIDVGDSNCAMGEGSLFSLTNGNANVVIGARAGLNVVSGQGNTLLGAGSGSAYTSNESSNICIGYNVSGALHDLNTLRIGINNGASPGDLSKVYIAGISGSTIILAGSAKVVLCDDNNALATISSGAAGSFLMSNGIGAAPVFTPLFTVNNTFFGFIAGVSLTSGTQNAGFGAGSLTTLLTGNFNTAIGSASLGSVSSGHDNVGVGFSSGGTTTFGSYNTFLGSNTGASYSSGESSNIILGYGTLGITGESNALRIGNGTGAGNGQINKAYVSGIYGNTALSSTAQVVLCDANNLLGTIPSSTAGYVLTSNGLGAYPSFQPPTGGGGAVTQIIGTPNEIVVSPLSGVGVVTLSISNNFIAPVNLTVENKLTIGNEIDFTSLATTLGGSLTLAATTLAESVLTGAIIIGGAAVLAAVTGSVIAVGANAGNNTNTFTGMNDTFVGAFSGSSSTSGSENTLVGTFSGEAITTGSSNTAVGFNSLLSLTTGFSNTAIGFSAGDRLLTGFFNTLLGYGSGHNYTSNEANNIIIGFNVQGITGESNILRIGQGVGIGAGLLKAAYIGGIYGSPTALATDGQIMLIDSQNLVGSISSGVTGQVLTSNGFGSPPSFQSPTGGGAVSSVTGTANQIFASPVVGAVVLTIPSTFIAPGSIAATSFTSVGTYLQLPPTTSTGGAIQMGGTNVFQTFGTENLFMGAGSGNTTLTGTMNTFAGFNSGHSLTSGNSNCGFGLASLGSLTSGQQNVVLGASSGTSLTTGDDNVLLGFGLGSNYTSNESFNIIIGNGITGTTAESNILRIGNGTGSLSGEIFAAYISGIHGSPTALAGTAQVVLCDGNNLVGSISSGIAGQVLTSNGGGSAPTFQSPGAGGAVSSVTGTANQIFASPVTGAVVLTIPATFIAPGSIAATTYLELPTTSPTAGALQINGVNVLHTFGTANTFVGAHAGNTTLSGNSNVGVGTNSLTVITSATANVAVGDESALQLTTGIDNVLIGFGAGNSYTSSESSNIILGFSIGGTIAESHVMRLGNGTGTGSGQINAAYISGIHGSPTALASTAQVVLNDANNLTGSISSGTAGFVLTSNGAGSAPSFQAAVSSGVSTVTGTANQITASPTSGAVVLTIPSTFTAPGSITATTNVTVGNNLMLPATSAVGGQILINSIPSFMAFGVNNTFVGGNSGNSLVTNTGTNNTGIGWTSLNSISSSSRNVAVGVASGFRLDTGNNNVLVGYSAGSAFLGSESNNITLGHNLTGSSGDNNILRIGNGTGSGTGQINQAFISGIQTISVTGTAVFVSSSDQLGILVSSRKFKKDIVDMGKDSDFIHDLRPVSFIYKNDEDEKVCQGLIAEEVAEINENLVVFDENGEPLSVHYDRLTVLLLNEIQKLKKQILEITENKLSREV